jgi:DUF971 family protein
MMPDDIRMSRAALQLRWSDHSLRLTARELRHACRCADCLARGVGTLEDVQLVGAVPVGRYGLQLRFSDGHDRGIYPWAFLESLGCDATAP